MSGYRITEATLSYKEALQAVEPIEPPAVGFTKPNTSIPVNSANLIKQNNLIIQLLTQVAENSQRTVEELGEIKRGITTLLGRDQDAKALSEVITKLENWKPGEVKPLIEKKKSPFYVFEDPLKIYQREKAKLSIKDGKPKPESSSSS